MSQPDSTALWTRRFLWLVGFMLVFRMAYVLFAIDLELAGDEAYYWDWGRKPDWCYFSKPPMIGWLMGLIRVVFGYHWEAVRLTSAILAAGTLTMIFLVGRALYDARTGFFAALLLLLTPAFTMLSTALVNDSPLMLCWSAALLLFWRALQKPVWGRWLILAAVLGLGVLVKQMMLIFPVMMILFVALRKEHRCMLKSAGFWSSIVLALGFMLPVLWWNQKHGWITLEHTKHHFDSEEGSGGVEAFQFPLIQAAIYAVLTWGLVLWTLFVTARRWFTIRTPEAFLLTFSLPGFAVVTAMALRQHVNENWPAVYYVGAFILAAGVGSEVWQRRAAWTGGVLTLAMHLLLPLVGTLGLGPIEKLDDMRRWSDSGREIGKHMANLPRPEQTFVYVLGHRNNASQLAFHLPGHPTVYRWNDKPYPESQYEIWPSARDKIGWDAFIVEPLTGVSKSPDRPLEYFVRRNFETVQALGQVAIPMGDDGVVRRFNLFLGRNMIRFPDASAAQIAAEPKLQLRALEKANSKLKPVVPPTIQ